MALLARKTIILAKQEVTYGVDAAPTGAANAILAEIDPSAISPLAGDTVQRANARPYLGGYDQIHVNTHVIVPFSVEMVGSGSLGVAPAWAILMLACGYEQTINAGTSVEYDPVSIADTDSITIYFHLDGQKHALVGARGTFTVEMQANQIPKFNFTFTGMWVDPASVADPTPTFTSFQAPVPVNNANTSAAVLYTIDLVLNQFTLDNGNTVVHMDRPNEEKVQITDRAVTGSCEFQATTLTAKNWFTTAKANTVSGINITHGPATKRVQITSSYCQMLQPKYGNFNGEATLQSNLLFVPSDAGNDEVKITVL
jgi:hypothetical protein